MRLPLVVGQLSVVFEPGHGGHQGRVVFHLALEHGIPVPLHLLVLRLLQDAGGLWNTPQQGSGGC